MANELVQGDPLLLRMLRAIGLAGVRQDTGESVHVAGADFASGQPATPGYPVANSLSTVAVFPYVKAAMDAIAADLASLDLKVKIGKGADAEPLEDHPVLDLLNRPSSRISGDHLRRQVACDLVLCGDAYVLVSGRDQPEVLLRLHPGRVKVVPMSDGQVSHFEYNGAGRPERYEWEQVLHFRLTSWEDDPTGMYGNGAIRALANDLTTDKLASELAAASAKTGRPTTVFSPADPSDIWSDQQLKQMRRVFDSQMSGTGGALFLGGAAKMESLQFSPRDLEYKELKKGVVESILAVFDCPPTRLGGSSVNYATAAQQAKHWWSGLQSKATIIDGQFSRLARMFPGYEETDVRVYHDFSSVEALSESRDERVGRVLQWVTMGVPLNDAAAYEGFSDLPGMNEEPQEGESAEGVEGVPGTPADQPMSATALNGAQVASMIAILGQVSTGLLSSDAAVALIGAAFPTVSEAQARRIISGAQAAPAEPADATRSLTRAPYDSIDFKVPKGVVAELKRGLAWHELGLSGDGLTPATVTWARRMSKGEDISPEKAIKMRAWLARHKSDKSGEGFSPGEDGFPSPGRVAWALWGGDAAESWSAKLVGQMEKADEKKGLEGLIVRELSTEADATPDDLVWRSFIERVHEPHEKKLEDILKKYLVAAGARAARRLKKEIGKDGPSAVTRQASKKTIDAILDELAEAEILKRAVAEPMREMFEDAVQKAFDEMPPEYSATMNPERVDREVNAQIGALVKDYVPYTKEAIADVVLTGIAEGQTIAEMQRAIQQSRAYTPARALRIARTETTRAVNSGTIAGYTELSEAGFDVRYRWLSAKDKVVRDEHRTLDRHPPIKPGEKFKVNGLETASPGGFGVASQDINCRCTVTAELNGED